MTNVFIVYGVPCATDYIEADKTVASCNPRTGESFQRIIKENKPISTVDGTDILVDYKSRVKARHNIHQPTGEAVNYLYGVLFPRNGKVVALGLEVEFVDDETDGAIPVDLDTETHEEKLRELLDPFFIAKEIQTILDMAKLYVLVAD